MVESAWAAIGYFLLHLDPDIRRIARRLEHLHLKILKKKPFALFNQIYIYGTIDGTMDVVQSMKVGIRVEEKKNCQANKEKWRKKRLL